MQSKTNIIIKIDPVSQIGSHPLHKIMLKPNNKNVYFGIVDKSVAVFFDMYDSSIDLISL